MFLLAEVNWCGKLRACSVTDHHHQTSLPLTAIQLEFWQFPCSGFDHCDCCTCTPASDLQSGGARGCVWDVCCFADKKDIWQVQESDVRHLVRHKVFHQSCQATVR